MYKEGEFLRRWEEFRGRWKHFIPVISVDKFIRDTIGDVQEEYPVWKITVEDLEDLEPEDGFKAVVDYIKSIWKWVLRWW